MDVDVQTCRYGVMNIFMWYSHLWGCCIEKPHEDRMKEGINCVRLSVDTCVDNETKTGM
jgi:hypothetical protein